MGRTARALFVAPPRHGRPPSPHPTTAHTPRHRPPTPYPPQRTPRPSHPESADPVSGSVYQLSTASLATKMHWALGTGQPTGHAPRPRGRISHRTSRPRVPGGWRRARANPSVGCTVCVTWCCGCGCAVLGPVGASASPIMYHISAAPGDRDQGRLRTHSCQRRRGAVGVCARFRRGYFWGWIR